MGSAKPIKQLTAKIAVSLLRVKMVLNEGGEGVPLSQLTDIANEAEKFLRYLAEDADIAVRRGEWLARNFMNGSVRFDVEREAHISLDEAKEFNRKFEYVDLVKTDKGRLNGEVNHRTLVQYTKVAKALGPHEKLAFGLYRGDAEEPSDTIVDLVEPDIFVAERARALLWNDGVYLKGADCLHVATALLDGCSEFLTLDGRIKKHSKFATTIPELKRIGLEVLRPSQTNSLPNEYRTDDLFKGKGQETPPGKS